MKTQSSWKRVIRTMVAMLPVVFHAASAQDLAVTDSVRGRNGAYVEPRMTVSKVKPIRLYGNLQWIFGIASSDFFQDYKSQLLGPASTFEAAEGIRGGVSSFQFPDVGIGLDVGYYRVALRETYTFRSLLDSTRPDQTVGQEFVMNVVPVFATVDYFPVKRQFTAYVGAGVGLSFINIRWNEALSATQLPGARKSGLRYDESHVVPSGQIRSGVSLGWDASPAAVVRPSLFFEITYTIIPFTAPLFSDVAPTLDNPPDRLRGAYAIQAGGVGVHAGISLLLR